MILINWHGVFSSLAEEGVQSKGPDDNTNLVDIQRRLKRKSVDKITGFKPTADPHQIHADIFCLDSTLPFVAADQHRKNGLHSQDFDFLCDQNNNEVYSGDGKIMMGKVDNVFSGFGATNIIDGGKGEDKLGLGAGICSVMQKGSKYGLSKDIGYIGYMDFSNFEIVGSL